MQRRAVDHEVLDAGFVVILFHAGCVGALGCPDPARTHAEAMTRIRQSLPEGERPEARIEQGAEVMCQRAAEQLDCSRVHQ